MKMMKLAPKIIIKFLEKFEWKNGLIPINDN